MELPSTFIMKPDAVGGATQHVGLMKFITYSFDVPAL